MDLRIVHFCFSTGSTACIELKKLKTRTKSLEERERGVTKVNEDDSNSHEISIPNVDFDKYVNCNREVLTTDDSDICNLIPSGVSKEEIEDDYVVLPGNIPLLKTLRS